MNLCLEAVTNAETNHSLNLSTIFRYLLQYCRYSVIIHGIWIYMFGVLNMCSSTRSRAACAMNWFKCRWSSFRTWQRVPSGNWPIVGLAATRKVPRARTQSWTPVQIEGCHCGPQWQNNRCPTSWKSFWNIEHIKFSYWHANTKVGFLPKDLTKKESQDTTASVHNKTIQGFMLP